MHLQCDKSLLLMVDFQAGLLPVIDGGELAIEEASWLGGIACLMDVPVWLTEQNPERLGGTAPSLLGSLNDYRLWQKKHFGVMEETEFSAALKASGKTQIVLCGTEAHICVLQTGLGLLKEGYELYWLSEASASRRPQEAALARERACAKGANFLTNQRFSTSFTAGNVWRPRQRMRTLRIQGRVGKCFLT